MSTFHSSRMCLWISASSAQDGSEICEGRDNQHRYDNHPISIWIPMAQTTEKECSNNAP